VYQVASDNVFQNEMFNGNMGSAVVNGINATPTYAAGHGWQSEAGGMYQLAAGTAGHDAGVRIANFNDAFAGAAPDVGAAESGTAAMTFGIAASTGNSGGTAPQTIPTIPTVPTAPGVPPVSLPTSFGMDSSAYTISAGQSVTFTATIPGDGGSLAFQANGTTIGNCAAVPVSKGRATCTTSSLPAGSHAIRGHYTGTAKYGAGIAGPITQTVNTSSTGAPADVNVHGLWWGSSEESGWGVNLAHQGNIVFATWFTYDADGNGQWLVMSKGEKTGPNSFAGTLYRTTGPAFNDPSFDPARVVGTPVGSAALSFTDSNNGTFAATVDGVTVTKAITRQIFRAQLPACAQTGDAGSSTNYQALWWRPNGAESGWGVHVTHQGDNLFVTWFTYDANGQGMWLAASNVTKTGNARYAGTLYRTTGPAFNSARWDPSRVKSTAVGTVELEFSDGNNGTFSYSLDGVRQSKPITRQLFSTPATVCQ
jgi:hypothetical protein